MVEESFKGENCKPDESAFEKMEEVEKEIHCRVEECSREQVESQMAGFPKEELAKEPTPDRIEKILRDGFHAAPREEREMIYQYKYTGQPANETGLGGATAFILRIGKAFIEKAFIEVNKGRSLLETAEFATHELREVTYRTLSPEQLKELKALYFEAKLGVEGKEPLTPYAWKNPREYFCDSMAKFEWEPETLKEKDVDMFHFCKEIHFNREVERIKEQLAEGGFISLH